MGNDKSVYIELISVCMYVCPQHRNLKRKGRTLHDLYRVGGEDKFNDTKIMMPPFGFTRVPISKSILKHTANRFSILSFGLQKS